MRQGTEPTDEELLEAVPAFLAFGGGMLAKALPVTEGGRRIIYIEASNEDPDYEEEVMLQKALTDSAGYFLRHGNVDLGHYTLMGPSRDGKPGVPNHLDYEIGKPLEVIPQGRKTMVKAELYQGEGPMARNAAMVWDSLTQQSPPARWYPSVGGAVLAKAIRFDAAKRQKRAVITRVRWNNIALDRTPVNLTVPTVTTAPFGVFAKSLGGLVLKGLEAGSAIGPEGLTGGGALRRQSLDRGRPSYFDARERLAGAVRRQRVPLDPAALTALATKTLGLSDADAAEMAEHFLADLREGRPSRKKEPAHAA